MPVNIGEFAARRALLDGARTGVISGDRRLTFREFDGLVEQVAAMLARRGIGPGDRVAALLRNGIEFCALYYAAARIGAILCNINWRLAPPEIAYILGDSGARLLIHEADFAEAVAAARPGTPLEQSIALGAPWQAALDDADGHAAPRAGGGSDPLLLVYTSGTTGRPKGAVLTHDQMFWVSTTMAATLDYRHGDINLVPVPMFHVGGMSFATIFTHFGATAILLPAWEPSTVLGLIEAERVNHFFAVAAMLRGLLDAPGADAADLSSVRWILAGGAPVPPDLIRAFDARGIPVQQTYGSTETAGPATCVDLAHVVSKAGSAGLPFFHTDLKIVDTRNKPVPAETVGEILIRGPHLISEYWRNPAATEEAFVDGWFRSGDLARFDADGYLYIVDRRKDMIVSGGENVYPAEVEAALADCPGVAEVAVVGMPDDRWGEAVCAIVVATADRAPPTLEEVRDFCRGRIAGYKIPRRLIERDTPLPRNATGKLQKHLLAGEMEGAAR